MPRADVHLKPYSLLLNLSSLTYLLQPLEQLFNWLVEQLLSTTDNFSINNLQRWLKEVLAKDEVLRPQLMEQVLGCSSADQLKLLIRQYQSGVTQILDYLLQHQVEIRSKASSVPDLFQQITRPLEGFLGFLDVYFPNYYDRDQKMPDLVVERNRRLIGQQLVSLEPLIIERVQDQRLVEISTRPLKEFVDKPLLTRISHREMAYYEHLAAEMEALGRLSRERCVYSALKELLILMNFNDRAFLYYFYDHFKTDIEAAGDAAGALGVIYAHKKEIMQMHELPGTALYPDHLSVRQQLTAWLSEEAGYFEAVSGMPRQGLNKPQAGRENATAKLKINLSAEELSLLARVLMELDIIVEKNVSLVLRFVSSHFMTKRSEEISYHSLHSKYYELAASTLKRLKEKFFEGIKVINQLARHNEWTGNKTDNRKTG